jgi:hypothetical protein
LNRWSSANKATFLDLARFAAEKFGYPLLDLSAFDDAQIQKSAIDRKLIASHRVVPPAQAWQPPGNRHRRSDQSARA